MVKGARGYTLVALIVGLTVMAILIAAVLPMASAESQRDKEAELIFRGFQYAEGIRNFRRRYGRYPNTLKEMFEMRPRTQRKLWKDPMTNSDKWGLITLTTGAPLPGTATRRPPGGGAVPTPAPTPVSTPGFGASPQTAAGPITGVYSTSKKKGYRLFSGRENYNEWRFTEQTLFSQAPSGPALPPGPGIAR
ncbi:MAG: type II secretion system protein [Thermoanaerobaculia bacterium]